MFCSKCGTQNSSEDKFCKNCGFLLENNDVSQQTNNVNNLEQKTTNISEGLDPNYINQAVNPNMKKWAILSIVVPVVAIIWYIFIGLSFYLAIVIAAVGFEFARKGEMANKKLATIGKVSSGILVGMAIIMLVLQLLDKFA